MLLYLFSWRKYSSSFNYFLFWVSTDVNLCPVYECSTCSFGIVFMQGPSCHNSLLLCRFGTRLWQSSDWVGTTTEPIWSSVSHSMALTFQLKVIFDEITWATKQCVSLYRCFRKKQRWISFKCDTAASTVGYGAYAQTGKTWPSLGHVPDLL